MGGFQIFWKKSRLGRVGYLTKGPVAAADDHSTAQQLHEALLKTCGQLRLVALLGQAPDWSSYEIPQSFQRRLVVCNPTRVVDATYLIDVQASPEELRRRMSPSLRRNLRKAEREHPLTVREGQKTDLPIFHQLMSETCKRQQVAPNPATLRDVENLWDGFARSGSIRLTLAETAGRVSAAKLSIGFGETATAWKKGWDGTCREHHANERLEEEGMNWSRDRGFQRYDLCSFQRTAAEAMLRNQSAEGLSLSSRDEYHLRFGGKPMLLPRPYLLFGSRTLRAGFKLLGLNRLIEAVNRRAR